MKNYYIGNESEYDTWLAAANTSYGITGEGIPVTKCNGEFDTGKRIICYSKCHDHLTDSLKKYWQFRDYPDGSKTAYDRDELIALGYIHSRPSE